MTWLYVCILSGLWAGAWAYLMARAGVWAAVRHISAKHDGDGAVCFACIRKRIEK